MVTIVLRPLRPLSDRGFRGANSSEWEEKIEWLFIALGGAEVMSIRKSVLLTVFEEATQPSEEEDTKKSENYNNFINNFPLRQVKWQHTHNQWNILSSERRNKSVVLSTQHTQHNTPLTQSEIVHDMRCGALVGHLAAPHQNDHVVDEGEDLWEE